MPTDERESIWVDGDEGDRLQAVWSRSGKRLILTIWKRGELTQIELRRAELAKLQRFFAETNAESPG
jgi:hypothetical protein